MSEHFSKVMSKKSDEELIQIASNYSKYSLEALSDVLEQIRTRNIESVSTAGIELHFECGFIGQDVFAGIGCPPLLINFNNGMARLAFI